MKNYFLIFNIVLFLCISCKNKIEEEKVIDTTIPVTLTSIDTTAIESFIDLNATATYLVKNNIKANTTGYLNSVNVKSNDYVSRGKVLFTLKTRESKVLGNTINKIDPSLHFGSAISVRAETNGFISAVNVQQGDYVQDGDLLAIINDSNSFGIVLSLPYNLKKYVSVNNKFSVFLPDGKEVKATVQKFLPSVDMESQTQSIFLKCDTKQDIPENLIVKVRINKSSNKHSISLPKSAVLSDETETNFWIMKLINSNTAVKIPIQKGVTTADKIEITAPILNKKDKILLTGNYGVADTIKIRIVK
ncbi:MAG: biotin/lipoyl-binding protein [Flavobacterium sp.]|nr:biotin/lipoyl-binding protein [Flavobacterium sp.]